MQDEEARSLAGEEEGTLLLTVLTRSIGYLCVAASGLKDEPLEKSVQLLRRLGFSRIDCAAILDTTPEKLPGST